MKWLKKKILKLVDLINSRITGNLKRGIDEIKILEAKQIINQQRAGGVQFKSIHDYEFCVFSQFGDDGIIQYLINEIGIEEGSKKFIEFGVEDYTESNTRFLLVNNNWKGLVMDCSDHNIASIKCDEIYWRYDLTAIHQFVTRDNINKIIKDNGFSGQIGLLHIDIDGNDYWVWESIKEVDPTIVIMEYNSVFGNEHAITIPYDPKFERNLAHSSNLFWGCSLGSLVALAAKKGYAFVGCNSTGINAYFVKKTKLGKIKSLTLKEGYVESKYRESRDSKGNLTFISGKDRIHQIEKMKVFDVKQGRTVSLKSLIGK